MTNEDRLEQLALEIEASKELIKEYQAVLKAMPGGCTCTSAGRMNDAAKKKYTRETINPEKKKLNALLLEKHNLEKQNG